MKSIRELLESVRVIAIVGLSDNPSRDSYRIGSYMQKHGYHVIPVNPTIESVLGEKSYPDLKSVPGKIDLVNVFRRMEYIPGIVDDAIAVGAGAIWLQLGIEHPEAEERARQAGMEVVSDRCIYIEHSGLGL